MKRTLDVNIGGFVFHLDEDAYNMLERYLNSLKRHYRNAEDGDEIISDIESRIAELLHERKSGDTTVVELEDINAIINILGDPEQIIDEEPTEVNYKISKKLYRDADNRILGGVAAGIAAYLGLPIALVRILYIVFAIASFGIAVLIYFIFWIVVPKALTARQKLEMRGDPVNISNIERSIRDEYNEVKNNIKKKGPKVKKDINSFWDKVENFFSGLGRVVVILIGCLFLAISITALLSIIGTLFIANWVIIPFGDLHLYNLVPELLMSTSNSFLFLISAFLVAGIPFILLLYAGLKMIINFKRKGSLIVLSLICLWIFGIVNISILSAHQVKYFSKKAVNYSEVENLAPSSDNSIYIKCLGEKWNNADNDIILGNIKLTNRDGNTVIIGRAELDFEKSYSENVEVTVKRVSRGKDSDLAYENLKKIDYKWNNKDSVLYLNNAFTLSGKQIWRAQELEILVKVPEGMKVVLDKNIHRKLDINTMDFYNYFLEKRNTDTWIMGENGELKAIK